MTTTKKILVVDDDPDMLEHSALILKAEGYEVHHGRRARRRPRSCS